MWSTGLSPRSSPRRPPTTSPSSPPIACRRIVARSPTLGRHSPPSTRACRNGPPEPGSALRSGGSANGDQVHDEDERLVRSDRPASTPPAAGEHGRDRDPSTAADPHSRHPLVPAGDDLALAQTELEGAATVP